MKRISTSANDQKISGFFAKYQTAVYDSLIDDGAPTADSLLPLYVTSRRYSAAPGEIDEILDRLPSDFRPIYDQTQQARVSGELPPYLRLDYYELDLLDFIFNVRKNRVLRLVGSVGVGKTTFLKYIFTCLRDHCDSLKNYIPVYIGFMKYPTAGLREDDLSDIIWSAICQALRDHLESSDQNSPLAAVHSMLQAIEDYGREGARKSGLYALFNFLATNIENNHDFEFVFIYDNVDHLSGNSVSTISQSARALFQLTRSCVILAMRPPAFATDIETDAHRGAFYTFRIALPPPSLRSIILRRLRRVLTNEPIEYILGGSQLTFMVHDVERAVRNTVLNVVDEKNEKMLLVGVANNNIRLAAAAFAKFLRWPGLRPDIIMERAEFYDHDLPGGFSEHLLKGLMLGSNSFYRDDNRDRPVISNILVYRCSTFKPDYLIQHRILSLLFWADATIHSRHLIDWLKSLGYRKEHANSCIEHMLKRALVYSPESEHDISEVRHLAISDSGRYYLENFFSNPEFLLEAIVDVDLLHSHISSSGHVSFLGRIDSAFEYLHYVEGAEKVQIQHLLREPSMFPHVLGAIHKAGLLQRSLISALRPLVRRMHKSHVDEVRAAADSFEEKWDCASRRTEGAEKQITEIVFGDQLLLPSSVAKREMRHRRWGQDNQLILETPRYLTSGDANKISVVCHLSGDEKVERIYTRLSNRDIGFDEFMTLDRSGVSHEFDGHVTIPWSREPLALQEIDVSVFADTKPLLHTVLRSEKSGF